MMDVKDQGIKLFGKKIALPEDGSFSLCSGDNSSIAAAASSHDESSVNRDLCLTEKNETCSDEKKEEETDKAVHTKEHSGTKQDDKTGNPKASQEDDNPKTPSIGKESVTLKPQNTKNDKTDTTKTLKKPDKILPCPRCNSMDTKFCYYNNYNVNQPRHFCKNCQRYWTAGGSMRNVPVGAGRRKNKSSVSICSHVTMSEALQGGRVDPANEPHQPTTFKTNGTVLSFNSDPQKKSHDVTQNGNALTSTSTLTLRPENAENAFPSQVPCIPWPYPWNSSIPVPIPVPFFPTPYWSYSVPGNWSMNPWMSPLSTPNQKDVAEASSHHLGKHSREGELIKHSNDEVKEVLEQKVPENSVLHPKTLRIVDPDEAAKSSIWETLGIKDDCILSRGGLFKAFERKGADEKSNSKAAASPALQANPAATSRSVSFHERA